jgi:hypothetical protein
MMTAQDCLRAAWQALLRGDTAERDRLCGLANNVLNASERIQKTSDHRQIVKGDLIRLPDGSMKLKLRQ